MKKFCIRLPIFDLPTSHLTTFTGLKEEKFVVYQAPVSRNFPKLGNIKLSIGNHNVHQKRIPNLEFSLYCAMLSLWKTSS